MKDRIPTRPGRVLITPEGGGTPYYATVQMADEPTEDGTPLNKASLLSDATAALFGLTSAGTVNEALSEAAGELSRRVRIQIGSYVGDGTYGSDNPNTLTFDAPPQVVIIRQNDDSYGCGGDVFIRGETLSGGIGYTPFREGFALRLTWAGNGVSWYSLVDYDKQLNEDGMTYWYCAILY